VSDRAVWVFAIVVALAAAGVMISFYVGDRRTPPNPDRDSWDDDPP
jgi:hypothetical protein